MQSASCPSLPENSAYVTHFGTIVHIFSALGRGIRIAHLLKLSKVHPNYDFQVPSPSARGPTFASKIYFFRSRRRRVSGQTKILGSDPNSRFSKCAFGANIITSVDRIALAGHVPWETVFFKRDLTLEFQDYAAKRR